MGVVIGELLESGPHPATLADDELLALCELGRGRTSGPGGQHRNKVETLVILTHRDTGVVGRAGERRSAEENKRVALRRLRLELATRVRVPVPAGEIRSELWLERCRNGRISCNPKHRDYPSLLAEALDAVAACGLDAKRAATRLDCTQSQLVKLVKEHPPAFATLNAARRERGMHEFR